MNVPVAVVGLGVQGTKVARGLARRGYEIAAGCDIRPERRAAFLEAFPGASVSGGLDAVRDVKPAAVVVATLADEHLSLVRGLVDLGVGRILCEKPLANTVSDLRGLGKLVASGASIGVNHVNLWAADHARLRALLGERTLGPLVRIESAFKSKGFGNIGTHFLASALFLTGARLESVESAEFVERLPFARRPGHADYNGRARYRLDGVVVDADNRPWPGAETSGRLAFVFERGRVEHLEAAHTIRVLDATAAVDEEEVVAGALRGLEASAEVFADLLDAAMRDVLAGRTEEVFRCAGDAVEAVIGAQLAHARRAPVSFPLPDDAPTPFLFS
jgi:predicted dehydrogenase